MAKMRKHFRQNGLNKLRNDDLVVFIRVVDSISFSATARELQIAPKTISKQIARLERCLGVTLFDRNTRNLHITEEGKIVAEKVRIALSLLDEVEEIVQSRNQELTGTIRLTAPVPFGRKFVASAIADFRQLHPKVGFDLLLTDQIQDLYSSNLDLAIRMGELTDSRLMARRITENRRILVASPIYIEAYGAPKKIEDLMQHHCLIFSYPGMHQNIWQLKKGREEKNIAINGTLCSDNGDILHEWCVAGLGVSLRETWDIYDELQSGQLIKVLTDWEAIGSKISLVQPRREIVPKRLTVFNEFLIERWQHAPWDN